MSPSVHTHFFHQYTSIPVCTISWLISCLRRFQENVRTVNDAKLMDKIDAWSGSFGKKDIQHYSQHHSLQMERTIETAPYHWQTNNDLLKCVFECVSCRDIRTCQSSKWLFVLDELFFFDPPRNTQPFQNWQSQNPNEREPHELVKITERRMKQTGKQQMIKCRTMSLTSRCRAEMKHLNSLKQQHLRLVSAKHIAQRLAKKSIKFKQCPWTAQQYPRLKNPRYSIVTSKVKLVRMNGFACRSAELNSIQQQISVASKKAA